MDQVIIRQIAEMRIEMYCLLSPDKTTEYILLPPIVKAVVDVVNTNNKNVWRKDKGESRKKM